VADGWCWFVLREEYCWLVAGGWFVLREKYCWLVADKPSEQAVNLRYSFVTYSPLLTELNTTLCIRAMVEKLCALVVSFFWIHPTKL
jgi:hypothetical protein